MFSKACEYAIKATIYIAENAQTGEKTSLKEVSEAISSPTAYTSKILQQLTHHQIIQSEKGPNGGYSIDKSDLDRIKLSHIVHAIDGDNVYKGCGLGLDRCNEKKPCPVHHKFKVVREQLRQMLETTSVGSLTMELMDGLTYLKR